MIEFVVEAVPSAAVQRLREQLASDPTGMRTASGGA